MKARMSQLLIALAILMKLSKPLAAVGAKVFSVIVKLLKGASVAKVGLGVASFGAYSILIDWRFAACVLLLIGIHESGHVWAMRRMGMRTRGFYFVPFFGGMAVPEEDFPSAWAEGYVALMGPLWGLAVTLTAYLIYLFTSNQVFAVAACWMAFVNLLNLIPVFPLDGGRVLRAVSETFSGIKSAIIVVSISMLGILYCMLHGYWLFVFFGGIGLLEVFAGRRKRKFESSPMYETMVCDQEMRERIFLDIRIVALDGMISSLRGWRKGIMDFSTKFNWRLQKVIALGELRKRFEKWERKRIALYKKAVAEHSEMRMLNAWEKETWGGFSQSRGYETSIIERGVGEEDKKWLRDEITAIYREATEIIPALREHLESAVFRPDGIDSKVLFLSFGLDAFDDFEKLRKREIAAMLMSKNEWARIFRFGMFNEIIPFENIADSPAALLMLFMADEAVLDSFIREYKRHKSFRRHYGKGQEKPREETPITSRQAVMVAGGFVWLVVILFSIMALTGGHQAAEGAVEFFKSF